MSLTDLLFMLSRKSFVFNITLFILFFGTFGLYFFLKFFAAEGFRINEISFTNNQGIDWIEIYNPSINSRSLKGFYLTDTRKDFQRFEIKDDIVVPNGGFVVIYGENLVAKPTNSDILNFNIKNGETLYLIAPTGTDIVDSATALITTDPVDGATVGRFPDGGEDFFIMSQATPGQTNQKDFLFEMMPRHLNPQQ